MIILDRRCILIIIVLCTSHLRHSAGSQGSGKLDSPPWPLLLQAAPGGWCWWRWRWCPRCRGRSPCRRGAGRETGQTCWPSPHRPWRESPAVSVEALRIISWCEVNGLIVIGHLGLTAPLNRNRALTNATFSPRARSAKHPDPFGK